VVLGFSGTFIVLHGLVQLLNSGQSQRLFELRPRMLWPDGSRAFSEHLGDGATRPLASVCYGLAATGFVTGGIGILAGQAWWRPAVVCSAAISSGMVLLLWDGKIRKLAHQGLIALLINVAILVGVLILRWPKLGFKAKAERMERARWVVDWMPALEPGVG
jgi:hypothetical protein